MRSVYDKYCEENARNKRINLLASWLTSHNDMLHIKEQLYLPPILVEVGNLQSSQFHCVGQEHELATLLLIKESYKSKMRWISFLAAIDGQLYLRISQYSLGQSASPLDALVLQIGLSPDNKERLRTMYAIEFLEVVVATVEDVVSTCLNGDLLLRLGVMH